MSESSWVVVVTKPLAEEVAAKSLRRAGWRVYLPRYRKILRGVRIAADGSRKRTRGFGEVVLRPLFPGYLFAEFWPDQQWSGLRLLAGVGGLLGGGLPWLPHLLGDELVELIHGSENTGAFDDVTTERKALTVGAEVRVSEMQDMVGRLVELSEDGRARVLLEMLGRQVRANVSAGSLVAVA